MAVTLPQYEALIERLEIFAQHHPTQYKVRVGVLATLGYAYIFLILVALLAVFSGIILLIVLSHTFNFYVVKFAAFILIPALLILKSLWVKIPPPPKGIELKPQQVPQLFELIDELIAGLETPPLHKVLLSEDFNAGIVQRPRLGILGWQQNYLVLGLPLMHALSPEQFRAVLAHELGHLSGNHSRFAGWIYRVRQTYDQILENLEKSHHQGSSVLFEGFFNWYVPFFNAYSFVLARMNEYEADRCAQKFAGTQNAAEALINVAIKSRFLQQSFWPKIYQQARHKIEPPAKTYTNLLKVITTDISIDEATTWLDRSLTQKTSHEDTHPCLADRLIALGYQGAKKHLVPLPPPASTTATQQFLNQILKQVITDFDINWKQSVSTSWRQQYAYSQEIKKQLKSLEKKAKKQSLTPEEAWNRAVWTADFKGNEAAIPLLEEILISQPAHVAAHFLLGQILLEKQDISGIGNLEKAMEKDPQRVIAGCEIIYNFYKERGQLYKAKAYQERAEQSYLLLKIAQQERSNVNLKDIFLPHDLPEPVLQELCQELSIYPQLESAYLIKKAVQYFPEHPLYILAVKRRRGFFEVDETPHNTQFMNQLEEELQFSGNLYMMILNQKHQKFENKFQQIEGSLIYKK
jgi:Zn-dependent protease with chaperone function